MQRIDRDMVLDSCPWLNTLFMRSLHEEQPDEPTVERLQLQLQVFLDGDDNPVKLKHQLIWRIARLQSRKQNLELIRAARNQLKSLEQDKGKGRTNIQAEMAIQTLLSRKIGFPVRTRPASIGSDLSTPTLVEAAAGLVHKPTLIESRLPSDVDWARYDAARVYDERCKRIAAAIDGVTKALVHSSSQQQPFASIEQLLSATDKSGPVLIQDKISSLTFY
jgi:hypothetical protein